MAGTAKAGRPAFSERSLGSEAEGRDSPGAQIHGQASPEKMMYKKSPGCVSHGTSEVSG